MRENFGRNKRKIQELKKARREQKRLKRQQSKGAPPETAGDALTDTTPQENGTA